MLEAPGSPGHTIVVASFAAVYAVSVQKITLLVFVQVSGSGPAANIPSRAARQLLKQIPLV